MKEDHYGLSSPVETPWFSCVCQTWCWISDGIPSHHWWELHKRLWQRASQCPFHCFWMLWCYILWLHPRRLSGWGWIEFDMWVRLLAFGFLAWIILFWKTAKHFLWGVWKSNGNFRLPVEPSLPQERWKRWDRNFGAFDSMSHASFHFVWNRSLYATLLIPLPAKTLRQFSVWLWKYQAKGSKVVFWLKSMLKCMSQVLQTPVCKQSEFLCFVSCFKCDESV